MSSKLLVSFRLWRPSLTSSFCLFWSWIREVVEFLIDESFHLDIKLNFHQELLHDSCNPSSNVWVLLLHMYQLRPFLTRAFDFSNLANLNYKYFMLLIGSSSGDSNSFPFSIFSTISKDWLSSIERDTFSIKPNRCMNLSHEVLSTFLIVTLIGKVLERWESVLTFTCIMFSFYIFGLIDHIWPLKTIINYIYFSLTQTRLMFGVLP